MKKYLLGMLTLLSFQCNAQSLPCSLSDLAKELEVEDLEDYVYILKDIDGDKNPEMFVKAKNYNIHYGLTIKNGKPHVVILRETPNYTEYGYTDDGYFYMVVESGYGRNYDSYWKLKNSEVVFQGGSSEDASTENIEVSYFLSQGPQTKENYVANSPKGEHNSFYSLDGWKDFPIDKANSLALKGKKTELAPATWQTTYAEGDFNKDGIQDLAVLSFPKDNKKPYVGIYLGVGGGNYKLFAKNKNLVTTDGGNISVNAKGVITVRVDDSDPATDMGYSLYLFRYQNNDFYLIGRAVNDFDRSSHKGSQWSYNYSTQKLYIHEDGKADELKDIDEPIKKFTEVSY